MTRAERRREWEEKVAAYRASGQSVSAWCTANNVKPERLRYWLRKLEAADAPATVPQWLSVEVSDVAEDPKVNLYVRVGQAVIEVQPGFDPALLREVVRSLSVLC